MRPQPSMVPDQMRLLQTEDYEELERREERGYSDFSATGCESAGLCVLFGFTAALIVVMVILILEVATGRWNLPAAIALVIIICIVAVILLACTGIGDILQRIYDRRNNPQAFKVVEE